MDMAGIIAQPATAAMRCSWREAPEPGRVRRIAPGGSHGLGISETQRSGVVMEFRTNLAPMQPHEWFNYVVTTFEYLSAINRGTQPDKPEEPKDDNREEPK